MALVFGGISSVLRLRICARIFGLGAIVGASVAIRWYGLDSQSGFRNLSGCNFREIVVRFF